MIPSASNIPDINVTVETSAFLPITPLDAPVLSSPTEQYLYQIGVFDPLPSVTFLWAAVAGATDYEIEVADKSSFDSILKVVKVTGGALTVDYVPIVCDPITHALTSGDLQFFPDVQYYWRVRATAGVVSSPWSKVWEFGFKRQSVDDATLGNQFFQVGNIGDPLPSAADLQQTANETDNIYYDPVTKALKVITDMLAGTERWPTIPQVAGDLPAAANGDLWFDTAVSSVPGPGEVISMVWSAGMGAYIVTYAT